MGAFANAFQKIGKYEESNLGDVDEIRNEMKEGLITNSGNGPNLLLLYAFHLSAIRYLQYLSNFYPIFATKTSFKMGCARSQYEIECEARGVAVNKARVPKIQCDLVSN